MILNIEHKKLFQMIFLVGQEQWAQSAIFTLFIKYYVNSYVYNDIYI